MAEKKKNTLSKEIVLNDMISFLSRMEIDEEKVKEGLLSQDENGATFLDDIHAMFNDGSLEMDVDGVSLIQTLRGGDKLKFTPRRAKVSDLNRIKPPNYDRMDAENKRLIPLSFLTGKTYHELIDYYASDLQFGLSLCVFL